jgi:uncharacterized protein
MTGLDAALWPWSGALLAWVLVAGFGAGAVRGFAGFGFSALVVASLSPFVEPGPVVAAVMLLEALASAVAAKGVADAVDRRWLLALLAGNAVFVPIGVAALAWLPVQPLRLLVGGVLLCGAVGLRLADGRSFRQTAALRGVASVASGFLQGLAASGGVVAAMLMAATRLPPNVLRATMITFLLYVSLYALGWGFVVSVAGGPAASTLLGADALRWLVVLAPAMVVGMRVGNRAFGQADPDRYRRFVLHLLIVIAALGLATTLVSLARS